MRLRPVDPDHLPSLDDGDAEPRGKGPGRDARAKFGDLHDRLEQLQRVFYADGRFALLVVLQGRDASGKDGTVRNVCGAFNPQGCRVTSFDVPTAQE